MFNPIEEKRRFIQAQIQKSFDSGINISEEIELEKAHKDGDHHPTKPWVWVSSANGGKGDWRVEGGRAHKKAGASTTDAGNDSKTALSADEKYEFRDTVLKYTRKNNGAYVDFDKFCNDLSKKYSGKIDALIDYIDNLESKAGSEGRQLMLMYIKQRLQNKNKNASSSEFGKKTTSAVSDTGSKVDIAKIPDAEFKRITQTLEKKNPDHTDAPRYLEEEAMSDKELKNFHAVAEHFKNSSKINKLTQEYCRKWAELAKQEMQYRNKSKSSSSTTANSSKYTPMLVKTTNKNGASERLDFGEPVQFVDNKGNKVWTIRFENNHTSGLFDSKESAQSEINNAKKKQETKYPTGEYFNKLNELLDKKGYYAVQKNDAAHIYKKGDRQALKNLKASVRASNYIDWGGNDSLKPILEPIIKQAFEPKKDSTTLKTDYKSSDVFQVGKEEWEVGSSKDKCKISFFNTETSFAKNMVIKYVDDNGKDTEIKISGSYGKDHPISSNKITDDFVENVRNGKEDVSRMYFEGKAAASKFALKFLNNRGKQSKKSDTRDKIAQDAGFKDYEEMKGYQDYVTQKNLLKKRSTSSGMRLLYQQEVAKYEKDHADLIKRITSK